MKKILSHLLGGTLLVFAIAATTNAQIAKATISQSNIFSVASENTSDKSETAKKDELASSKATVKAEKAHLKALKASTKALSNFNNQFRDASDVQWSVSEKTISAYMFRNDVQTRVVYDKKGNRIHALLFYYEDKMPVELKESIHRAYPGFSIIGVQEVQEGSITFYIVHLEDAKQYKEIAVYDGEMNVYKEYNKAF